VNRGEINFALVYVAASEREAVDLVDMMIMDAMLETLRCNAGSLLTDDCVCAMFEEAFHMRSRRGML
jgi:hypothetical protein